MKLALPRMLNELVTSNPHTLVCWASRNLGTSCFLSIADDNFAGAEIIWECQLFEHDMRRRKTIQNKSESVFERA